MFTGISKDTDIEALLYLDDQDIARVCQANQYMRDLCNNNEDFWRKLIQVRFPYIPMEVLNKYKGDRSWSEYYIRDLRPVNISLTPTQDLVGAAEEGRLDHVMILVNNGAVINQYGDSISLLKAADRGYSDIVRYLVENGADVTKNNSLHLLYAAKNGDSELVKYLIDRGSDIHVYEDGIITWAARNGDLDLVKYLVEKGVDIHAYNDSAVKWAHRKGYTDIVDYLVSIVAPDPR